MINFNKIFPDLNLNQNKEDTNLVNEKNIQKVFIILKSRQLKEYFILKIKKEKILKAKKKMNEKIKKYTSFFILKLLFDSLCKL